ncbi:MAG: diguanylate cyclase, partial [Deltaproteobacteria bacterium]|nr:diguanylate cyclase [Deltaproteobacteria bacterium]
PELTNTLRMIGELTRAKRCYLGLVDRPGSRIGQVYEWCPPGTKAKWTQKQGSLLTDIQELKDWLEEWEVRPSGSPGAGEDFGSRGESLLIPLFHGRSLDGFIGLDSSGGEKPWSMEIIHGLQVIGQVVVTTRETEKAQRALQELKDQSQHLLAHIHDITFSLDSQGRFTHLSPAIELILAYTPEELIGQSLASLIHPKDLTDFQESLAGGNTSLTLRLRDKKGNFRLVQISSRRSLKTGPAELTGILREAITPLWAKAYLIRNEKKYRQLFENAMDGIFQRSFNGKFITANPACARILGYSCPAELIAATPGAQNFCYGGPERQAAFQQLLREFGVVQEFEYEICRKDGLKILVSETAQAIRDAFGDILFYEGIIKDITEQKQARDQIKFLSFHDVTTGLYNRAFFEEEMKRLNTLRQLPLSIIMGDVNGLKLINDAFGHDAGDQILAKIATILKECCRKEDVIARLGGDEFAIFLPQTNQPVPMEIIQRIKSACQNISRDSIPLSVALGTTTKEEISQDIHQIIKEAEDQMYREKLAESKSHKAAFVFSLRRALAQNYQETEEHIQHSKQLAMQFGRALGLPMATLTDLGLLAMLHDIGKISLPLDIIRKSGNLSPSEWEAIRKHPEIGGRIANSIQEFVSIAEGILTHHEWWNGKGYPQGLSGEQIPLIARIFAIVDAYTAMTRGRPYKNPLPHQIALNEIRKEAGRQFDPRLAEIFLKTVSGTRKV